MTGIVNPEQVLRELAELWVSLGKEGQSPAGSGVLRACTMTLVVAAEAADDWSGLGETIAALMPEHPARTLSLRLTGPGDRALSERVYSQCWMPFGQRRQICCEQVEISASDAALCDLPSVVRPLAVPDLPLILWCRSHRLLAMPEFAAIASVAGKVIVDSEGLPLSAVAALAGRAALLGDLAWTRITRWRDTLSHVFENKENLARLDSIREISIGYHGLRNSAAYFAGWLAGALPGRAISIAPDPSCDSLRVALSGSGFQVQLERRQDRLVVTVNGQASCTNLPLLNDYSLMREELSIVQRDRVFTEVLARALPLAYPGN